MTTFPAPVVATAGSTDPAAPLVVLLHGRGSNEREIIALADQLPAGPAYAAVRAPIAEGGGYAWFANRGIGRPVAESLRVTMDWFRGWLDNAAPAARPVVLLGFSGGAAFAGGLLLDDPDRYAGAAILYGTLPFDAGVPTTPARLAGVPVVVAHGEHDTVIPRELLDRTWDYLLGESGAPTIARRDPVGHGIAPDALATLAGWLSERLTFLAHRGRPAPGPTTWPTLPGGQLPPRVGARGFMLARPRSGPDDAFLVPSAGEFAHVHPGHDGCLHLALPMALATDVIAKGWGVAHPLAGVRLTPGMVMLFGPRDHVELETVLGVITSSHAWASGQVA